MRPEIEAMLRLGMPYQTRWRNEGRRPHRTAHLFLFPDGELPIPICHLTTYAATRDNSASTDFICKECEDAVVNRLIDQPGAYSRPLTLTGRGGAMTVCDNCGNPWVPTTNKPRFYCDDKCQAEHAATVKARDMLGDDFHAEASDGE